jgi:hypothetical protein
MLTDRERRRCEKLLAEQGDWFGRFGIDGVMSAVGVAMVAFALRPDFRESAWQLAGAGGLMLGVGLTRLFIARDLALLGRLYAEHERDRGTASSASTQA